MAFSFRAGTNWCHDFPKLAKESGFHFNIHRSHIRVDWNRISSIDIDRVIRERDFSTIDENINNVVDYHLETEYDIKILDSNFVKLFRLAQLSVEYLLYCKQYLDHSVIILKDELRSKLDENVKLKKELSTSEDNMQKMREKFRDKYRFLEKRFSDSHGEIHKCPFCPKTFMADVFMNAHVTRRHSNASQLSMASPVHEQYKAQAEKLQNEIKALKERLNETERVIRSESMKTCHNVELNRDKYSDLENGELGKNVIVKDRRMEEEYEKYREEMNHLTSMLFSEIRSLKQNESKSANYNEFGNENLKELLKQQETEINRMRDQLQQLSVNKSIPDLEMIQTKLNAQENYWRTKLDQLEYQHRQDIETLYRQIKITQNSANRVKIDYLNKMGKSEISSIDESELLADSKLCAEKSGKSSDLIIESNQSEIITINQGIYSEKTMNPGNNKNIRDEILIEDLDKISDIDTVTAEMPINKFHRVSVNTIDSNDVPTKICVKRDNIHKNIHTLKPRRDTSQKLSNQQQKIDDDRPLVRVKTTPSKSNSHHNINAMSHAENVITASHVDKTEVSPNESDETDSQSESTLNSRGSESEKMSELEDVNHTTSSEEETTQESEQFQTNECMKNKEELKIEIQEALEQKLRDLGVDPQWQQIPNATYRQLIDTVKYHRSINSKKYYKFENLRQAIVKQIADSILKHNEDNHQNCHVPKLKSQTCSSNDKSVSNKLNIELLPRRINRSELHESERSMAVSSQLRNSGPNRDNNASSISDRYTLNPSELTTKAMELVNLKNLSHSHESIKGYMKNNNYSYREIDSPLNMNGPITTSTPQRDDVGISSSHETTALEITSQPPNSEEFVNSSHSPKHNKSVLKSSTGSTGSLVKKKVIFDLQTNENDRESHDFDSYRQPIVDSGSESESDFEVSKICEEQSNRMQTNLDNIVLKTSQCEKIAEITRKIEIQLNAIRHKPLGGIETMFTKGIHERAESQIEGKFLENPIGTNENDKSEKDMTKPFLKFSEPTSTSKSIYHSVSSNCKFDMKDSNLDIDIEEILREN